jgi:hypothetical protein
MKIKRKLSKQQRPKRFLSAIAVRKIKTHTTLPTNGGMRNVVELKN